MPFKVYPLACFRIFRVYQWFTDGQTDRIDSATHVTVHPGTGSLELNNNDLGMKSKVPGKILS